MRVLKGIETVLGDRKYLFLFAVSAIFFFILYIFEWNLILFRDMYVRADLSNASNVFFLAAISILSALATTLSIFNLGLALPYYKKAYGYFAIVPAFLTSACPTCAPFLLSFTSTSFAIGLALAEFGTIIKTAATLLLLVTILYVSSCIGACKIKGKN